MSSGRKHEWRDNMPDGDIRLDGHRPLDGNGNPIDGLNLSEVIEKAL